ncbi:hypothetical protein Tco_0981337 [Tanacetum coccineum]
MISIYFPHQSSNDDLNDTKIFLLPVANNPLQAIILGQPQQFLRANQLLYRADGHQVFGAQYEGLLLHASITSGICYSCISDNDTQEPLDMVTGILLAENKEVGILECQLNVNVVRSNVQYAGISIMDGALSRYKARLVGMV